MVMAEMHKQTIDSINESIAFIGAYIDKNVIPTKSVGQTLRGCSQELHTYVKIRLRQDDPL